MCGQKHLSKWRTSKKKRNSRGQFVQGERTLTKIFLGVTFFLATYMIGWNTIVSSIGLAVQVENTQAEEVITITWQDEVKSLLKDYGVNVEYASKLIQCESSWNPKAVHQNKGSVDRGLWQINSYFHPEVSKDCAFDTACSTIEAIKIIKTKGFDEWSCVSKGLIK